MPITEVKIIENDKASAKTQSVKTRALLDTGAMLSAITTELMRECENKFGARDNEREKSENARTKGTKEFAPRGESTIFPTIKINKTHVRSAFNQKGVNVDTKIQMKIQVRDNSGTYTNYTQEFYIIESLFIPMILGADFIGRNGIAVTCATNEPIVANANRTEQTTNVRARAAKESKIAGESEGHDEISRKTVKFIKANRLSLKRNTRGEISREKEKTPKIKTNERK